MVAFAWCTPGFAVTPGRLAVLQRCPGEGTDRLTVLVPDGAEADKPEEELSVSLAATGATLVAAAPLDADDDGEPAGDSDPVGPLVARPPVVARLVVARLVVLGHGGLVGGGAAGELGRGRRRGVEGVPQRVRQHGDRGQRDGRRRRAGDPHDAVDDLEVGRVDLEGVGSDTQRLLPDLERGQAHGVPAHHGGP